MLIALFFLLLLSPCCVAFIGGELVESSLLKEWQGCSWALPRPRRLKARQPALKLEEEPLAEDIVLRSFAKGVSQRRVVVQDVTAGVRLNIAQVRAARTEAAAYHHIPESRAELLARRADQARITLAQGVLRSGRDGRASGEEYALACARLRWSESTTEPGWSEHRQAQVAA